MRCALPGALSMGTTSPASRFPSSAEIKNVWMARVTSFWASAIGNPASAVIVAASSARRCSISSPAFRRMAYRSCASSRTDWKDRCAAATAASTCSREARSA